MYKLTQEEADILIAMIKKFIDKKGNGQVMELPNIKERVFFEVVGEKREDKFLIHLEDKRINEYAKKFTCQGRLKSNDIILMRLDINPTGRHKNPDGEKIHGNHIHIYKEGDDDGWAIPIDIDDNSFIEVCYNFFERFNIVEPPYLQNRID